ncbi:XrtB/PEP-CTERM-associated polysaccharide biosynthesis outer membrane protein EpsL [Janthinobacterium sp. FW305-129]|uniref:XrtB/PEP-CTERM-associated polysaccharide biosynthesis outer membrane protein EpsL n=1 Tax=Janthinobacterium sp. FW305-129 TaxID=2775054 RepID=UPI001E3D7546|nr:XrtB/PEP-CTERM-associated polysaccharide biosynthesis outer membrane protein EpsL [Janthinobacterium sp. FW305-129]
MLNSLRKKAVAAAFTARPRLSVALVLAGTLASGAALADISDTIKPFVATSYSYDDNLMRLPDDVPGFSGPRSDTSRMLQAGFLFNRPIGRQVLTGQAKWSKVSFNRFSQFDYDGKDYLADLEWHIANHLEGHVGASYAQTLTPFSDFQSTVRNLRTQRREYLNGAWRFHPSWRVRGGLSRDRYLYDLPSQAFSNWTEDATEFGVDYLARSNSRIGLQLRHLNGKYPNRSALEASVYGNGYRQDEIKANVFWELSGITQVEFLGGWVRHRNNLLAGRDDSGTNGRLSVYWKPLGKVNFTGIVWREFGSVDNSLVTSSLNTGASVGATWAATSKVRVDALLRQERRDFAAISGLVLPGDGRDTTRTASLGATYAPHQKIQLGVRLFHERREGVAIIDSGSYRAKGISFNGSVQF